MEQVDLQWAGIFLPHLCALILEVRGQQLTSSTENSFYRIKKLQTWNCIHAVCREQNSEKALKKIRRLNMIRTLLQLLESSVETCMTPNAVAALSYQFFELHTTFISSVIDMKTIFPFHSLRLISWDFENFSSLVWNLIFSLFTWKGYIPTQ